MTDERCEPNESAEAPPPRRFQFRLATLFWLTAAAAVALAMSLLFAVVWFVFESLLITAVLLIALMLVQTPMYLLLNLLLKVVRPRTQPIVGDTIGDNNDNHSALTKE